MLLSRSTRLWRVLISCFGLLLAATHDGDICTSGVGPEKSSALLQASKGFSRRKLTPEPPLSEPEKFGISLAALHDGQREARRRRSRSLFGNTPKGKLPRAHMFHRRRIVGPYAGGAYKRTADDGSGRGPRMHMFHRRRLPQPKMSGNVDSFNMTEWQVATNKDLKDKKARIVKDRYGFRWVCHDCNTTAQRDPSPVDILSAALKSEAASQPQQYMDQIRGWRQPPWYLIPNMTRIPVPTIVPPSAEKIAIAVARPNFTAAVLANISANASSNGSVGGSNTSSGNPNMIAFDCEWNVWSPWTVCAFLAFLPSDRQRQEMITRSRTVKTPAVNGGQECAKLNATQSAPCPPPQVENKTSDLFNTSLSR